MPVNIESLKTMLLRHWQFVARGFHTVDHVLRRGNGESPAAGVASRPQLVSSSRSGSGAYLPLAQEPCIERIASAGRIDDLNWKTTVPDDTFRRGPDRPLRPQLECDGPRAYAVQPLQPFGNVIGSADRSQFDAVRKDDRNVR